MSAQMQEIAFNLRLTSKQLVRQSKKCEKNEKAAKKKVADAMKKGNVDGAKIYASNAIREKNQALNYLRLASRIDAVSSRVDTAVRMNMLTHGMRGVVAGMDKTLASMDVDKISRVMDKFEKQFDDLDVRSAYMDDAMQSTTALSAPEDDVSALMNEVAAANGLEVQDQMGGLSVPSPAKLEQTTTTEHHVAEPVALGASPSSATPAPASTNKPSHNGDSSSASGQAFADSLAARLAALKK